MPMASCTTCAGILATVFSGDMYRCWAAHIAEAEGSGGKSECRLASLTRTHLRDHDSRRWNSLLLKGCVTRTSMARRVPREAPA